MKKIYESKQNKQKQVRNQGKVIEEKKCPP